jgi:hypothetical protein
MCYALIEDDKVRYIPAPANGFFYRVAEPSWPAGRPLAAGIGRVLQEADPEARAWRVDNDRRWRERLAESDVGVVLQSPRATVVYLRRTSERERRVLEADETLRLVPLLREVVPGDDRHLQNLALIVRRAAL